jgi:5-enolpyruvylshikimate-3-phosphate synthase
MAFAFALLGLARPGVRVKDARCVNKSWPGFWSELQRLGAEVATR